VIDATIQKLDNKFVMFLKDETKKPAQKNLKVAFSDHLTGPYTNASEPITGNYWAEGPTAIQIAGAKGIVLAAVGDGNATQAQIGALASAAADGIVVVRSSRVGSGIVRRNIEVDDDALGFVAAYELNPQKARVLLRLRCSKPLRRARSSECSQNTRDDLPGAIAACRQGEWHALLQQEQL
jgi:L-asparaginase/Glu-tRNA(Gln) amidotransferase subunit D